MAGLASGGLRRAGQFIGNLGCIGACALMRELGGIMTRGMGTGTQKSPTASKRAKHKYRKLKRKLKVEAINIQLR